MKLIPGFENALPLMALALILAGLGTAYLTPYVRAFAHRLGVVDRPDPRRVNRRPVARGGGLAVVAAFVPAVGPIQPKGSSATVSAPIRWSAGP